MEIKSTAEIEHVGGVEPNIRLIKYRGRFVTYNLPCMTFHKQLVIHLAYILLILLEVLYEILLYLHKAYDALDCDSFLLILAAYVVVPRAIRLLCRYWDQLPMAARAGEYYGTLFKGFSGVNQGDPLSPTIFSVVVYAVLCHWVTVMAASEEVIPPGPDNTEVFRRDMQRLSAYFCAY